MNAFAQMSNAIRAERERGKEERLADFSSRFSRFAATRCQPAVSAGNGAPVKGGTNAQPPPTEGENGVSGASDVPPTPERTECADADGVTDTTANAEAAGETTTEQAETPNAENAEAGTEGQDAAGSKPTDEQAEQPAEGEAAGSVAEAPQSEGQHEDEQQNAPTQESAQTATDAPVMAHSAPEQRKRRGINFKKGGHK